MTPPDPTRIFQLATGYWPSAALLAAHASGLFTALAAKPQTAAEIATTTALNPRATEMLLNTLCALDLLAKTDAHYRLTPVAETYLLPDRPGYLGAALDWSRDQYAAWGQLTAALRTGQPVVPPPDHLGADPHQTRTFVLAMHQRARGVARGVVGFLPLDGCRTALDVGGGPGTYAALLAQKYPNLHLTVLDLPGILTVTRELVTDPRITTLAGDATTGEFGTAAYDAVLFLGVLHQMSPDTIQRMLAGAARALTPGGRVLICDLMLDETKTQPLFSTLFSLQMLLTTHTGHVFAAADCARWLTATGFANIHTQHLPPPLPYTVITAVRNCLAPAA